jgi:hypothetical protein
MHRRQFLSLGAFAALARSAQQPAQQVEESVTASATADATPRVAIVPSNFDGSQDHDGTEIAGLADPRPTDAELEQAHIDAMVRKVIELAGDREGGGLKGIIEPEDWVVIKIAMPTYHGLASYLPGTAADLRVVRSLLTYLGEAKLGLRFSIAEGPEEWIGRAESPSKTDGWNTDWGGACGGLSYEGLVKELSGRFPHAKFEIVDLNSDRTNPTPAPAGVSASKNKEGAYHIPQTIQQCDKLISVAPLRTHTAMGVALSIGNYLGIAPGAVYGMPGKPKLFALGAAEELAADLFSYHPADFCLLGGCWGVEGDGPKAPGGKSVRYNLIIGGANAVAVDAVAASVMGFDPAKLKFLDMAELGGFGIWDTDSIWVRGKEIEEAQRPFARPPSWKA